MLSHKFPEDKAKQWLEEVIAPYGGRIGKSKYPRKILFGRTLTISQEGGRFKTTHFCLEGRRRRWNQKEWLPTYDWLLACFYTVLRDMGCQEQCRGKYVGEHSKCWRCRLNQEIRVYLKKRRGRKKRKHN